MNQIATISPTRRKLDVQAFYRMAEAGIFGPDDRIELIDGELLDMALIGNDHFTFADVLNELLVVACLGRATVSVQNPINLDRLNLPQPDLAVYRGTAVARQRGAHALEKALLVVEVADGSLRFDRTVKLALYARMGVPEYWIVDVDNQRLLVHRRPVGDDYLDVQTITSSARVALAAEPSIAVDVGRLFD